jgi:hypothetical protein
MFPKLLLIILVAGATAAALLVNRQQRIDTAHEISIVHQRLLAQDQTLWTLQRDLAQQIRPERIRYYKDLIGGSWAAIPAIPRATPEPTIRIALIPEEPMDEDLGG